MNHFNGKTILVTGAASGIGRATALELARQGGDLIITDINEPGLQDVASQIRALGRSCLAITADITEKESVAGLATRAVAEMGKVDILFNNAGIVYYGEARHMSLEHWEEMIDVNVWGAIRLTHALLPHMIERGSGQIVTTASIAGLLGSPAGVAYSTTKFAMVGFCEALRAEVKRLGIDVSVVCPGPVESSVAENGLATDEVAHQAFANSYVMTHAYPAEKAACDIVKGMRTCKDYIVIPGSARMLWYLKRLSPSAVHYIMRLAWPYYARRGGIDR